MKRIVAFILFVCTVFGTVANAQEVSAPEPARALVDVRPPARLFKPYTPTIKEDPMVTAVRLSRQQVVADATSEGVCAEWAGTAFDAGWPPHLIPRLLRVVYRESRCLPGACSTPDRPDLRRCRDWGLTQINDYSWKRTVRSQGLDMPAMWDPYENLRFAWWLYNYSVETTGCGWTPWSLSCKNQDRA